MGESDLTVSSSQRTTAIEAPTLPYQPPVLRKPAPPIGLIGCGAITPYHLDAYAAAAYTVTAFCDIDEAVATERRDKYNPDGAVYTDYNELLQHADVPIVDIATHVEIRGAIVEAALRAGKHVLSQKPFTLDLAEGERLANLADELGLKLAVNQNGRWAPTSATCATPSRAVTSAMCRRHTWPYTGTIRGPRTRCSITCPTSSSTTSPSTGLTC